MKKVLHTMNSKVTYHLVTLHYRLVHSWIMVQSASLGVVAGTNSSLKFREANLSKIHIPGNFLLFSGFS